MVKQPRRPAWNIINRTDSSAVAMRSVAAALQGKFLNTWDITPWQRMALRILAMMGKRISLAAVERFIASSGVNTEWAKRITSDDLASWAVSLYDDLNGPWDAIIIGAPNGGVAHLATALGVPFLSQHFLTSYRDYTPVDDVKSYQAHGAELGKDITHRNDDLAVINHYDPLHDRFLVKYVNHIRYKFLRLPEAYQAFILRTLRHDGTIFFSDCRYTWPMYFVGERCWFQVGGLGAVNPWEFIQGRPEIAELQRASGSDRVGHWGLPGRMAFEMPESEWGSMPPFRDMVKRFAQQHNYHFVGLEGGHPQDFSLMAFRVWQKIFEAAGIEPQGVLIETFTQVAPAAPRLGALLPLWLPWNCEDSLDFLHKITELFPDNKPLLWLPLPNFIETFDMVSWDAWLQALEGMTVHPLGMRPRLYPADPVALYEGREAMMAWVASHPAPAIDVASVDTLLEEARAARLRP